MHEPAGMTYAEIDAALAARGVTVDPVDETFVDGKRPLDLDEVLALLPDASDCEIASYAETKAAGLRRPRIDLMVV